MNLRVILANPTVYMPLHEFGLTFQNLTCIYKNEDKIYIYCYILLLSFVCDSKNISPHEKHQNIYNSNLKPILKCHFQLKKVKIWAHFLSILKNFHLKNSNFPSYVPQIVPITSVFIPQDQSQVLRTKNLKVVCNFRQSTTSIQLPCASVYSTVSSLRRGVLK